jgi:hypothetical protein
MVTVSFKPAWHNVRVRFWLLLVLVLVLVVALLANHRCCA